MSITKAFRAALTLGVVSAPLALIGCDDAASTAPASGTPAAKPAEPGPAKPGEAPKPAPAPAPAEKK
jgi:hypothetical protein